MLSNKHWSRHCNIYRQRLLDVFIYTSIIHMLVGTFVTKHFPLEM